MTTPQRRAHPRFALRLSAEIASGEREFTATTRNLSVGGCCIESAYKLGESAEISVALFLVVDGIEDTDMPPLAVRGSVQWVAESDSGPPESRHLAGIRFLDVSAAQQSWLEGFLKRVES